MKVLFYCENLNACSYYRCILPSKYLHLEGISSSYQFNLSKEEIKKHDIIVFQKKYSKADLELLDYAKRLNKKTFYEIDDDLFSLPLWNPGYGFYTGNKLNFVNFIRQVDGVITTNHHLASVLKPFNSKVSVIPNHLEIKESEKFIPDIRNKHQQPVNWENIQNSESIKIGWAGSPTHREDLKLVTEPLIRICQEIPQIKVFMVLCADKRLVQELREDQIYLINAVRLEDYHNLLESCRWDIGLAPIQENKFNRSKSNLKVIEYVSHKIIPLATDYGPYADLKDLRDNNLLISENNKLSWLDRLRKICKSKVKEQLKEKLYNATFKKYNILEGVKLWSNLFHKS